MKLKKLILLAAAVTVMTAGCGNGAESSGPASDVTSVYVTREGAVTSVTVEEYDTEAFEDDEAGLLASVTEDLEAVTGPLGEGEESGAPASIRECTMKDGVATLLIDFKDIGTYFQYLDAYPDEENGQIKSLDVTTVADGLSKGYLTGAGFVKADGKREAVETSKVTRESNMYVAAVEGAALIRTDGEIVYVSDNVTEITENGVRTPKEGTAYIVFK